MKGKSKGKRPRLCLSFTSREVLTHPAAQKAYNFRIGNVSASLLLKTLSEQSVQKALGGAAATRTTIAVTYRLSTIRHADVIFVIEDGRIAKMGTHKELWRRRGK